MRSGRSSLLASLLTLALASFAGACASPLDEPIGQQESAMRIVSDEELADLPGCEDFAAADVRGGEVLGTTHPDLYAVSVGGQLVCADDGAGVNSLASRGLTSADGFGPLEGTPLPANTGADPTDPTNSGQDPGGTPLPANY